MEKMHHIQCSTDDIGNYVLLPGDPGRVPKIAALLSDAKEVAYNREFCTYTGTLLGEKVSVVSTGIGCPSAAIAMEELIKLGAHTFIRVGTCGCLSTTPVPGDCIVATGSIRRDGTSRQYLPIEFPAVPDFTVTTALVQAARATGQPCLTGIVECKDSYYGQHEPENSPVCEELLYKWKCFKQGGALGSEMETAAIFSIAAVRNVRAGAILHVFRNREYENAHHTDPLTAPDTSPTIHTAVEALKALITADREVTL